MESGEKGIITPKDYATQFHYITTKYLEKGHCQDPLLTTDFIRGLPFYYRIKVIRKVGLNFYNILIYNYKKVYKYTKKEIENVENNNLWVNSININL